jgi:hypothetical protein
MPVPPEPEPEPEKPGPKLTKSLTEGFDNPVEAVLMRNLTFGGNDATFDDDGMSLPNLFWGSFQIKRSEFHTASPRFFPLHLNTNLNSSSVHEPN